MRSGRWCALHRLVLELRCWGLFVQRLESGWARLLNHLDGPRSESDGLTVSAKPF